MTQPTPIPLRNIAWPLDDLLNTLVVDVLNRVPYDAPDSEEAEALETVARAIRHGSAAIALALEDLAQAVRDK